jgi:hypothetical protein
MLRTLWVLCFTNCSQLCLLSYGQHPHDNEILGVTPYSGVFYLYKWHSSPIQTSQYPTHFPV